MFDSWVTGAIIGCSTWADTARAGPRAERDYVRRYRVPLTGTLGTPDHRVIGAGWSHGIARYRVGLAIWRRSFMTSRPHPEIGFLSGASATDSAPPAAEADDGDRVLRGEISATGR